jgi:uncharacterized protein YxjI
VGPFEHDRYLVDQLVRPMINLYRITPLGADERPVDAPVAYVRQKRMALKEDIRFFAEENEARELWRIKARSLMEFGGRYDVTTPEGEKIGVLGKVFGKSLLRSTWSIMDADEQELAVAKERSVPVAILRRVIDAVPYGDFVPIPFHFTIDAAERHIGDLNRRFGIRDTYDLDVAGDVERRIDRRLAVSLGIALDALQSR